MNYIVLDLEWNQCPTGKANEIAHLPFEIIEIGAVKLDDTFQETDRFREIVKPQVYQKLHFRTKEIVSLRAIDFETARSFPEIIQDFLTWCGDKPAFCTWGPADLMELQRNLAYYKIPSPFPFPFLYYDIQKIFSIVYEDRKTRRSLEYAIDFLDLPKNIAFHSALSDARYTALIMQYLTPKQIAENSSVDYYRTPDRRRHEIYLTYSTYVKYISKPFESKPLAMKDRIVSATTCYLCKKNVPKKIRWFPIGSNNYCALAFCPVHGYLKSKARIRQNKDGKYYAIKTTKLISEEEAFAIREKKEIQNVKRKLRKQFPYINPQKNS